MIGCAERQAVGKWHVPITPVAPGSFGWADTVEEKAAACRQQKETGGADDGDSVIR